MKTKPLIEKKSLTKMPYRWFLTSSGKLVIGGKSSLENDELLKKLKKSEKEYIVMHTVTSGSPFVVIRANPKDILKTDIEESATFTGCFSRAWREGKKTIEVHVFALSQLYKTKKMKTGTWGIRGNVKKRAVELKLVLTTQNGKLRAVPDKTVRERKEILLKVQPGKNDKIDMVTKLSIELKSSFSQEEILSALPPGGVSIRRR